jgi:tetratricopeptide (TPR) repeat protein
MKFLALACVAIALALPAAAHADVGNRSALDIEFDELNGAISRDDCTEGLTLTRRITQRGVFKGFPDQARGAIWTFAALCADRKGLYDEALADARNASLVPGADASAWSLRFGEAVKARQLDDVPAAVETLAHTSPAALNELPVSAFRGFRTAAVAAGHAELAMRVYATLEAANYAPVEKASPGADLIWLDYAGMASDAGDARHASALIARLSFVGGLISAKLDGRFAAAVAADPARFDLKAAALRQLDHDRADMAAHPDRLADLSGVVIDFMALERFDEALTLTQSALDRIAQAPRGRPPFVDQARYANWLYDGKSRALIHLGRFDEGLRAMRDGARLPEQGQLNVSQTINLAGNLNDFGHPEDALAELKPFDGGRGASPYGEGWVHATRACAYQQLGRAAQLAPELAWLAAHRRYNTGARFQALLCAGSADDVAAELIAELNDPDLREAALVRLSEFDPPLATTPIWTAERALLAAVRARPDIRAAIAAAGHTERIPLCECAYVDAF